MQADNKLAVSFPTVCMQSSDKLDLKNTLFTNAENFRMKFMNQTCYYSTSEICAEVLPGALSYMVRIRCSV